MVTIRCLVRIQPTGAAGDPIDFVLVDVALEATGATGERELLNQALAMTGGFYAHFVR